MNVPRSSRLRGLLDQFPLLGGRLTSGTSYRRVRLVQAILPLLIVAVVVSYQLLLAQLEPRELAFWAQLLFYGINGPLVTYFVLGWISQEVRERERAENDLRDLFLELSESHARLATVQKVTRSVSAKEADDKRIFGYSLRTPRWRYTEWDEGKQGTELYDHDNDAKELTNLVQDAAHKSTLAELKEQLHAAVKASFPPSGKTPPVHEGALWAPMLTNP